MRTFEIGDKIIHKIKRPIDIKIRDYVSFQTHYVINNKIRYVILGNVWEEFGRALREKVKYGKY